jgi:hypothetical protein
VVAAARTALRAGGEDGDGSPRPPLTCSPPSLPVGVFNGGERWGTAADRFDRAARVPGGHPSESGPVAGQLRLLARSLLKARGSSGSGAVGGVAVAVALAALVAEIAAWQAARGRDHQAVAAGRTAADATELVLEHPPPAPRSGRARMPGGGNGRAWGTPRPRGGQGGPAAGRRRALGLRTHPPAWGQQRLAVTAHGAPRWTGRRRARRDRHRPECSGGVGWCGVGWSGA